MPTLRATHAAVLLAAMLGAGAHAQSTITREQVKAELAEAIRTGNMIGDGTTGQSLRELNPQRYPSAAARSDLSREQVQAELKQARLAGEVSTGGDLNLAGNRQFSAEKSQGTAMAQGRTRADVQAELREAIRTGNISRGGETDQLLKDLNPSRYAKASSMPDAPMSAASSPARILR